MNTRIYSCFLTDARVFLTRPVDGTRFGRLWFFPPLPAHRGQHDGRAGERLRVDVASVCNLKFRVSSASHIVSTAISRRVRIIADGIVHESDRSGSANSNN